MNQVVIFFVPVNATQQDLEVALREQLAALDVDRTRTGTPGHEPDGPNEQPLWTWFLPNPCY